MKPNTARSYARFPGIAAAVLLAASPALTRAATYVDSEVAPDRTSTQEVYLNTGSSLYEISDYVPGWAAPGSTNAVYLGMGSSTSSSSNSLLISGSASSLHKGVLIIGMASSPSYASSSNTATLTGGASLILSGVAAIGQTLGSGTRIISSDNTLTVSAGGHLSATSLKVSGSADGKSENNAVLITGSGSTASFSTSIDIGYGTRSKNNSVTMADGGLIMLGEGGAITFAGTGNSLRFDGGYLAWYGSLTDIQASFSAILANVQIASESGWTTAASLADFTFTDGADFSYGSTDLTGYTVVQAVPEPSSTALIALSLGAAAYVLRSRRRLSA